MDLNSFFFDMVGFIVASCAIRLGMPVLGSSVGADVLKLLFVLINDKLLHITTILYTH